MQPNNQTNNQSNIQPNSQPNVQPKMQAKKFNGSVPTNAPLISILLIICGIIFFVIYYYVSKDTYFGSKIDKDEMPTFIGLVFMFLMGIVGVLGGIIFLFAFSGARISNTYVLMDEQKVIVQYGTNKRMEVDYAHLKQPTITNGMYTMIQFENTYGTKCGLFVQNRQTATLILQTLEKYQNASKKS